MLILLNYMFVFRKYSERVCAVVVSLFACTMCVKRFVFRVLVELYT